MKLEELDAVDGTGFTAAKAENEIYKALVGISGEISRKKFALSSAELAEIEKARNKALSTVIAHFDNMERTVRTRRENLTRYPHIKFASLGFDCFPRSLLTRWGLKPPAKMGEPSLPFDLAIHPANAVAHILTSDFAVYFDGSLTFDRAKDYAVHEGLGIELNHEIGEQFHANDFAELKGRYAKRADNFRTLARDPSPTLFLHHTDTTDTQDDISRLFDTVRAMRGNKKTALVCLHTPPSGQQSHRLDFGDDVHVITQEYPFTDYVWHNPRHTFSVRGVKFEKAAVEKLTHHIAQIGWDHGHLMTT